MFGRAFGKRRAGGLASVGLIALALSLPGVGCTDIPGAAISQACPDNKPCQVRLTMLHTADIHSRLYPYDLDILQIDSELGLGTVGTVKVVGGVSHVSYVLQRERARSDRVLHLDSGDCFEGAPVFNFFSGEPEVRVQSALGTDAMVIGNHEFDRGALNAYRQFQKWSDFPFLAANYKFIDIGQPNSSNLGTIIQPFTVLTQDGLKVAVIGMGNLSSLGSIFNQPNASGILPLNTTETAQGYVDLLRPYVDVIVMLSHLGLDEDEKMIRGTTGIDLVMGGHNHIVINPPEVLQDCTADTLHPGYIWVPNPNVEYDPNNPVYDPADTAHQYPGEIRRGCIPRNVTLMHSGAFAKYVGRLDMELSNDPATVSPTGNPNDYDSINGFEVVSTKYVPFPIDTTLPDDPYILDLLQPYQRVLDRAADLYIIAGYSPNGAKRIGPNNGDSPLGNLIADAMWLRLGVQTDLAVTNSTGIRTDMNPGPVTIEEMYNIFPFDNTITKLDLSGFELREMFDFIARRSAARSCDSQAQIAGARIRLNCSGCTRPDYINIPCHQDADCPSGVLDACNLETNICFISPCADQVFVGDLYDQNGNTIGCSLDSDCPPDATGKPVPGICNIAPTATAGFCSAPIADTNVYEIATSNYLAAGGSGYLVLQRNTTQADTRISQRDATTDYIRGGKPCGYNAAFGTVEGLKPCATDADCTTEGDFVCACSGGAQSVTQGGIESCQTSTSCDPSEGRCVRRDCRDTVGQYHERQCQGSPNLQGCLLDLNACSLAGVECSLLACVDETLGAFTDNRVVMEP